MHYDAPGIKADCWCEPDPKGIKNLQEDDKEVFYPNTPLNPPGGARVPYVDLRTLRHAKNAAKDMHNYKNDAPGVTYCGNQTGTGDNVDVNPPKNNTATLGNCRAYLKVKDWV